MKRKQLREVMAFLQWMADQEFGLGMVTVGRKKKRHGRALHRALRRDSIARGATPYNTR